MVNLKGQKAHRTHPICKEFKEFKYFRMREETLGSFGAKHVQLSKPIELQY